MPTVAESTRSRGQQSIDGITSWTVVGLVGGLMALALILLLVIVRDASGAIMEALASGPAVRR